MSRINDALKRAKQAQRDSPRNAAPEQALRPVEPDEPANRGPAVWIGLGLFLVAGAVVIVALQFHRRSPSPESSAASPPLIAASTPVQLEAHPPASSAEPKRDAAIASTASSAAATIAHEPPPDGTGHPSHPVEAPQAARLVQTPASPNPAPVVAAVVPLKVPLRLQAIMFHPTHPSAMIGGKTLFVGDLLGDLRLVAIGRESATLIGGGQTNVLTLAQ